MFRSIPCRPVTGMMTVIVVVGPVLIRRTIVEERCGGLDVVVVDDDVGMVLRMAVRSEEVVVKEGVYPAFSVIHGSPIGVERIQSHARVPSRLWMLFLQCTRHVRGRPRSFLETKKTTFRSFLFQ